MNADQLWDTTMNPETRVLKQVVFEDLKAAEELIQNLMGKDVKYRKEFLSEHALEANVSI